MTRKSTSLFCILFVSLLISQAAPVRAHTPGPITVEYDFDTQVLTVEVTHSVSDVNTHYIIQIVVEKNSVEFTTRDYTSQQSTTGMSDTFDVPAVDGDQLRVTASCSISGQIVGTVTVTESTTTPTTTPTSTTTPTTIDPTVV
ncbi:MAG: hypothetical protein ACTSU3_02110, partial [Candidatus Thorarchaeota archaeon]